MAVRALLEIQLTGLPGRPEVGDRSWNQFLGGPETLLGWLETRLGLPTPAASRADRILELAAALDACPGPAFAASLAADRWGTAEELLLRHDELRLAGWEGAEGAGLPPLVRDLGAALRRSGLRHPDEAGRLAGVLAALEAGQRLPPHLLFLWDPPERWPARWRSVLGRLRVEPSPPVGPHGPAGSPLAALQAHLLGGDAGAVRPGRSLRWLRSRSLQAACEAVAAALAAEPGRLAETVVCCGDPAAALALDGALARLGLPTMGAEQASLAHPVLQLLPLILRLSVQPVDPALLLDLLALPVGPIPRRAARRLAAALAEEPGLGSGAWEGAIAELTHPAADPDGALGGRLAAWLGIERVARGAALPQGLLRERCGRVAQWAAGRARRLETEGPGSGPLAEALRVAAAQAATLGAMIEAQGTDQAEPQLMRLLEAALPGGIGARPHPEAAGAPRWVASLSEIAAPCARLIWLGLGAADRPVCRWSALELAQLRQAGIPLDDGGAAIAALREAERRGLARVTEACLAVGLPADEETRPHPLWLQAQGILQAAEETRPAELEAVLAGGRAGETAPWRFPAAPWAVEPPQPARLRWRVPPGLLRDRTTTSASELTSRLACPLQWVLNYAARLRPSEMAALPDDFQLRGSFGHALLEAVAGPDGQPLDPESAAAAVLRAFDARLPLDAAPLAQPARLAAALRLRAELAASARRLAAALASGGYRVLGFEVAVEGRAVGRELQGRIDCLVRRADGEEAVIDFKYAGREKYRRLLEEGRALQLATYAFARGPGSGGRLPAVAYLILAEGLLLSPAGSPLRGLPEAELAAGPPIGQVWQEVAGALAQADGWLTAGEPVPARPLQEPAEWPAGATLAIYDSRPFDPARREPCRYCHYDLLCGRTQLR